jgi:hypothetical protein
MDKHEILKSRLFFTLTLSMVAVLSGFGVVAFFKDPESGMPLLFLWLTAIIFIGLAGIFRGWLYPFSGLERIKNLTGFIVFKRTTHAGKALKLFIWTNISCKELYPAAAFTRNDG